MYGRFCSNAVKGGLPSLCPHGMQSQHCLDAGNNAQPPGRTCTQPCFDAVISTKVCFLCRGTALRFFFLKPHMNHIPLALATARCISFRPCGLSLLPVRHVFTCAVRCAVGCPGAATSGGREWHPCAGTGTGTGMNCGDAKQFGNDFGKSRVRAVGSRARSSGNSQHAILVAEMVTCRTLPSEDIHPAPRAGQPRCTTTTTQIC